MENKNRAGKEGKEAKEKKYKEALQKAEEFAKEGKYKEAWSALPKTSEYPNYAEIIRKNRTSMNDILHPAYFMPSLWKIWDKK